MVDPGPRRDALVDAIALRQEELRAAVVRAQVREAVEAAINKMADES